MNSNNNIVLEDSGFFIPSKTEYERLISYAKKVDRYHFMDLVHDSLFVADNYETCLKRISGGVYNYYSVNESKQQDKFITDVVCRTCNEIKPVSQFTIQKDKNREYLQGECKECKRKYNKAYYLKTIEKHKIRNKKRYERTKALKISQEKTSINK